MPSGICFRFVGLDFVSVLHWLEGDANRAAGDGTLAGGSGRLPFPLVASGVSRITSLPEPPIPGGPRIKFEPTHVGCYGLIGGVVRVTHRLIMPARCRRHAKRIPSSARRAVPRTRRPGDRRSKRAVMFRRLANPSRATIIRGNRRLPMDQYIERVVDLLDPALNRIHNMPVDEARQRVLSGQPEAVRGIDGS